MDTLQRNIPFFSTSLLSEQLKASNLNTVKEIMDRGEISPVNNKYIKNFESELGSFLVQKNVIGTNLGSISLIMALEALDLPKESEIITTPFTFQATSAAIHHAGLKPVFADINLNDLQLSDTNVENLINQNTSALLPVHLNGSLCEIPNSRAISKKRGIKIIEDSAQRFCENPFSSIDIDIACFSLGPTKNIVGLGEGGAIATNSEEIANKLKIMRRNGSVGNFDHRSIGYNATVTPIIAGILSNHLTYINEWNIKRNECAKLYDSLLENIEYIKMVDRDYNSSVSKYTILVEDRDELQVFLKSKGIEVNVYYPNPLHLQPCFKHLGYGLGDFPNTEKASRMCLSLPIHDSLTSQDIEFICSNIKQFYSID